MTNYIIRFAPELEVNAAEFVHAWNQQQSTASLAQASLPSGATRDVGTMSDLIVFLGGLATGVATNALYDGIKEIATRLIKKPEVVYEVQEVQQIQQQDGIKVVQIVIKEVEK